MVSARALGLALAALALAACGRWELDLARREGDAGIDPDGGALDADAGRTGSLCAGLITDTAPHPMSALARPAVGVAMTDPEFRATIRRVTATTGTAIVPLQSGTSAWNADESWLVLYEAGVGHRLYEGRSYAFVRDLVVAPADIEQIYWDASDPDVFYFPADRSLYRYRVASDATELVRTFGDCTVDVVATSSGGMSWDSREIGLACGDRAFFYDPSNDTLGPAATTSVGAPLAAASGVGGLLGATVVGRDLVARRVLDLASITENGSLGLATDGHDVLYTVAYGPGPAGSPVGTLVAFDLSDGSSRLIIGEGTGYPYPGDTTQISATARARPGWVAVSSVGDVTGREVLGSEILLADTSPGGVVCRVAHHRSSGAGWAQPNVVLSPSGTRALFASDWGGGAVDTYVVELPLR